MAILCHICLAEFKKFFYGFRMETTENLRFTAHQIIEAFGGATKLAALFGGSPKRGAISQWKFDGIPGRAWPAMVRIAAAKRIQVDGRPVTIAMLESSICRADQEE